MANLKIVICDTNQSELEGHARICRAICEKKNLPATVVTFSDSRNISFEMSDPVYSDSVDILIIEPDGGLEAMASYIRKKLNYRGVILYLSRSSDEKHYHSAFDVKAFNYAKKSDLERFGTVFVEAIAEAKNRSRLFITLSYYGEYRNIDIRDIYSFETSKNDCSVNLIQVKYAAGKFDFISTLSELEKQLADFGFLRVQRSFLVSIDAIHKLTRQEVILNNGESITISRGTYSELHEVICRWKNSGATFAAAE